MSLKKAEHPYEESAEHRTGISGWVCKTCRRFYGEEEHAARYCCAATLACKTDDCKNRVMKSAYMYCEPCLGKRRHERYLALPEAEWDGETPLVLDDDDRYFFASEDLLEYAEEHEMKVTDLKLLICVQDSKPHFDMYDLMCDYLPEGSDPEEFDEINKIVNDWVQKNAPVVWVAGKTRPTDKSVETNTTFETSE